MPDSRHHPHRPDGSTEDRFLHWVDHLVDPANGTPPPPDPDFADVAATATHIHRAAGLGTMTAPPTTRTDAIWESLMHTNTASAIPVRPGAFDDSPPPPQEPPRPIAIAPRPGWRSYLMVAALIAVIVAASVVALWQITGPHGNQSPDVANQPGFIASATPAIESADGCDLTRDILVFTGETPSFDGTDLHPTMAVVQPNGDFVITCDGVTDPEPLMTGVQSVGSLPWPGTVLLMMENGTAVAFNIGTEQHIELGSSDLPWNSSMSNRNSPWYLSPANDAQTDWRITNLKTMQTMLLSDEIGGVLAEPIWPSMIWSPSAPNAIFSSTSDLVLQNLPPNDANATIADLPERAMVVDETFETRRWIDTWGQMAISADGETIAYQTQDDLTPMIRVEDSRTGDILAEITDVRFSGESAPQFAFSGDGASMVYIDGNNVWLADWSSELTTTQIETGDLRPGAVRATGIAGRVLIERIADDAAGVSAANPVSILDTDTGNVTDVPGRMFHYGFGFDPNGARFGYVVMALPSGDSDSQSIIQVVDIATGEPVLTSEPMQGSIQTLIERYLQVSPSRDGNLIIASFTGEWSIAYDIANQTVIPIEMADLSNLDVPDERMYWTLTPSSDGLSLYAFGVQQRADQQGITDRQYFATASLSANPSWTLLSDDLTNGGTGYSIGWIFGIPTENTANDKTRTLEAQEITPIAASPAPATSASTSCDLTGDMPIFAGSAPNGVTLDTWLLLADDGTLTLNCDAVSTTIAEDVAQIEPTAWPATIVLARQDRTVELLNLTSGETRQLESDPLLDGSGRLRVDDTRVFATAEHSPWLLTAVNGQLTDWRITDLRSMESFLLSGEIGGVLPIPMRPWIGNPVEQAFNSAGASQVGTITFRDSTKLPLPSPTEEATAVIATGSLPSQNATLVLPGSIDGRRWIEISPDATRVRVSISADGSLLSYLGTSDTGDTVLRVEHTVDGTIVDEFPISTEGQDNFLISGDPDQLVYTNGRSISIFDLTSGSRTATINFDDLPTSIIQLTRTRDPNVVLVSDADSATTFNIVTGEIGQTFSFIPYAATQTQLVNGSSQITNIVTMTEDPRTGSPSAIQLIDPLSRDVLVETDPIGFEDPNFSPNSYISLARDGTLAVVPIASDRAMVLDATSGESWMLTVPRSEIIAWDIRPSEDGRLIYATKSYNPFDPDTDNTFYLTAASPDAEWVKVTPDSIPRFVIGAHDLPAASTGVQTAPLVAVSPQASPVASGCDLTGDMPIFAGSVPDGIALDTWLLLADDGTLTLDCDATSSTIATDVERVKPTAWPGAIALAMRDGSAQLINLTTGAVLPLEPSALPDDSDQQGVKLPNFITAPHSPWLVSSANDDHTDWRVTDLRSMESLLLSDEVTEPITMPHHPIFLTGFNLLNDYANGNEVMAIAFQPQSLTTNVPPATAGEITPPEAVTADGNVLLLPGSIEHRRWIDMPFDDLLLVQPPVSVHPDGSLIAYPATSDDGTLMIQVEQTGDGTRIAEIPLQADDEVLGLKLAGSTPHLVTSTGRTIEIVSWTPDIERTPVDIDVLPGDVKLYPTADPDVILVEQGGGAISVDVTDGTVLHTYQYVPSLGNQLQFADGYSHIGTMITIVEESGGLSVIQVVDPVTGDVLAESQSMAPAGLEGVQTIPANPIQLTQTYGSYLVRDGTLAILQLPPGSAMSVPPLPPAAVIVLDVNTSEMWMIKLPPYDDWYLSASPDGRYLYDVPAHTVLDGEREPFLMKSTGVGSDWAEVPAGSVPQFVIGTHALP